MDTRESTPPPFPRFERQKDTETLRFSPGFEESKEKNAWEWFQSAMEQDEDSTLESLENLFVVKLHPEYSGVVSSGVLTRKFAASYEGQSERKTKERFFAFVENRRQSALRTVSRYSASVVSVGFHDVWATHHGARTSMPYSTLILLLHHLGFDPLKPLRNREIKSSFQRRLGHVIVKQTALALRENRRVVLAPYIRRIAQEIVEYIQDFLFGSVVPDLKPGLEDKTLKARFVNASRGAADYAGRRGIEEPLYETGQMAEKVSYNLTIPEKAINQAVEKLYSEEADEMKELARREKAIKEERRRRKERLEKWEKENRTWRENARKKSEARRRADWNYAIRDTKEGKLRSRLEELGRQIGRLLNSDDFGRGGEADRKYEKLIDEQEKTENALGNLLGKDISREGISYSKKTFLDEVALRKKEREAFNFKVDSTTERDAKLEAIRNEIRKRKNDLVSIASYTKGVVEVVEKDGRVYVNIAKGKSAKDLLPYHTEGITQLYGWLTEAINMRIKLGS